MRVIALVIFLLGLFVLYGGFLFKPVPYDSSDPSFVRTPVYLSGVVSSERTLSSDFRVLHINNVSVACSCTRSYLESRIFVVGISEVYEGERQVRALSVRVLG
ncbi:MAG: hypothetical protein AABX53_02040 [Nanoarchaeota archaeon]